MLLSSSVSGRRPINAIAFGHHVEKARGSCSSPTTRITCADARRCDALRSPRSSSFKFSNVSASSIKNDGLQSSMARKMDAGLTLADSNGRGRKKDKTVKAVDLPQPFSGDEKFRNGEIAKA